MSQGLKLTTQEPTHDDPMHAAWNRELYPFVPRGRSPSMASLRLWMTWAVSQGITVDSMPVAPWIPVGQVGPVMVLGHWDDAKDKAEDAVLSPRFSARCLVPRDFYESALAALKGVFQRPPSGGFSQPEPFNFEEDLMFASVDEVLPWMLKYMFATVDEVTTARSALGNPAVSWPLGWEQAAAFLHDGRPLVDISDCNVTDDMKEVVGSFLAEQSKAVCFYRTTRAFYIAVPDPHDMAFEYQLKARFESQEDREKELRLVRGVPSLILSVAKAAKAAQVEEVVTRSFDMGDVIAQLEMRADDLKHVHYKDVDLRPETLLKWVIYQAVTKKASDVHFEGGTSMGRVRMRIGPDLYTLCSVPLDMMRQVVGIGRNTCGMGESAQPQDGRFTFRLDQLVYDVRASSAPVQGWTYPKLNFRLLGKDLRPLSAAGLAEDQLKLFQKMIRLPKGLILVTGPTGSGKTTTLYGGLSEINTPDINIHTVEDPVEYQLEGITQHQVDRPRGNTFAVLLRMLLRQDPDVILVGEIRDEETAHIAVEAAMTGHLVFATLHTNSAAAAASRLIDMGVEPYLLADTLVGLEGQRLVKALCPHCKAPVPVTDEHRKYFEEKGAGKYLEGVDTLYKAVGCAQCSQGYLGRVLVAELYPVYDEFSECIAGNKGERALVELYAKRNYRSMFVDGLRRVALGQTTPEEASQHNADWVHDHGIKL